MHPFAAELNQIIKKNSPPAYRMLSALGRRLYFPKGILAQSAEANGKAHRFNATIGIATASGHAMYLPSVMKHFQGLSADELFPYAPSTGKPDLRKKWRDALLRKNPALASKSFSLPIVASGVTHALGLVADLFIDKGDVVLVPDQRWENYDLLFGVRYQARIRTYPFFSRSGGFNLSGFRRALKAGAERGKLIVLLNFPNNPTGYSVTAAEAHAIASALVRTAKSDCNLIVVCDDAYFGLFYDGALLTESLFAHLAEKHPRLLAVKADGPTKEEFVWGFRLGFLTFSTAAQGDAGELYAALEKKISGAIRSYVSNCSHPAQSIISRAMGEGSHEAEARALSSALKARAAKVKHILSYPSFESVWEPYPFNSGYFMCLRLKNLDAEEYRSFLLERYGIGVIAVDSHDVRVAFSSVDESDLPELFSSMAQAARELQKSKPTRRGK